MKVLTVFIDMLRTNLLNIYDSNNVNTYFDDLMRKYNGTFFSNAYTPSPDTPRSAGCLWSSLYPKFNGCNTRIKYPKFYLNDDANFLRVLRDNGYKFNFYCNIGTLRLGIFPNGYPEISELSNDETLEDYLKRIKIDNNSFTFVYLPDYHATCDGYYASITSHTEGLKYIGGALDTINKITPFNMFDLIIFFSDHGFKLTKEKKNMLNQLNKNRTQVFLYVIDNSVKNQSIVVNNNLHSIMDIGVTILNYCKLKIPYDVNGIDLLNSNGHNAIVIEDHNDFTINLGQTVVYYGVRNNKGLLATDCSLNWQSDYNYNSKDIGFAQDLFYKYASFFDENLKQQKILDLYAEEIAINVYHYNGEKKLYKFNLKIWLYKRIRTFIKSVLKPFL